MRAEHPDPFMVLGLHELDGRLVVRTLIPGAETVEVIDAASGTAVSRLERVDDGGLFAGFLPRKKQRFAYRLKARRGDDCWEIDDPYRFSPVLGALDEHLISEGAHLDLDRRLGAHRIVHEGVTGTHFAVWAPNAARVSVVGDFNAWDGRRHMMRRRGVSGVFEIFAPGVGDGDAYKYEIRTRKGRLLLKADPVGFGAEAPPKTASVVRDLSVLSGTDPDWVAGREARNATTAPISIYEVHLGSWRRGDGNRYLSYRELAETLVPYVADMGFTHVELLPVSEYPFDGSWGYQPTGLFAPTSRYGSPADFKALVDAFHAAGVAVILDWVPGHFPGDAHGLAEFDGTALYEHVDPRRGFHPDWHTYIYNYDRREVANFLIANALYWPRVYGIDGLRVDAVASMLYLDYSREPGEWVPNIHGGRENLEAIAFLKRMNEIIYGRIPGITTIAEESTAWPGVSRPTDTGGLGFGYKW
ncbi:MAG: 1,4-alpha-glucan branching enzyme, partial [Hyphomicrobiales bacterium]|nr:1,4-alpha-glucan branching enzyme [Hyphomicrobiales bacterium]